VVACEAKVGLCQLRSPGDFLNSSLAVLGQKYVDLGLHCVVLVIGLLKN